MAKQHYGHGVFGPYLIPETTYGTPVNRVKWMLSLFREKERECRSPLCYQWIRI